MAIPNKPQVCVVLATGKRQVQRIDLDWAPEMTTSQAERASRLLGPLSQEEIDSLALSIWGRKASDSQQLKPGDRVELTRSLTVDPKVARRERFVKQGAKAAGLFAKRRAGAKAGY